ncbi:hypothetical protein Bca52824_039618 [Brassica carinata]|uniref:Uncharacterized protein n=1 Tax=Brassica carinata TaxID=52824 RepID=A0A8X7UW50_BRACI|nr:hypothetical protein Bca52824_039618 [Brassica carinata]
MPTFEVGNSKRVRSEIREGNGGWSDGVKHDDQARSYKSVVINCNFGQQSKDKDGRDYYWKGRRGVSDTRRLSKRARFPGTGEAVHTQEEKELMPEEADMEKGKGQGNLR